MKQVFTSIVSFLLCYLVYGQDQNADFAATKGTWLFPVSNVQAIDTMTTDCLGIPSPSLSATLKSNCSEQVRAIQPGKIGVVADIGGAYMTIVINGDYFIVYVGLSNPTIRKGDWVEKGAILGTLAKGDDEQTYELMLMLSKGERRLNINRWFDWSAGKVNCFRRKEFDKQL